MKLKVQRANTDKIFLKFSGSISLRSFSCLNSMHKFYESIRIRFFCRMRTQHRTRSLISRTPPLIVYINSTAVRHTVRKEGSWGMMVKFENVERVESWNFECVFPSSYYTISSPMSRWNHQWHLEIFSIFSLLSIAEWYFTKFETVRRRLETWRCRENSSKLIYEKFWKFTAWFYRGRGQAAENFRD